MFNVQYTMHNFFPFLIVYMSDTSKTMNFHMHALVAALFGVVATAARELCTLTTNVFTVVVDLHASE